jgi:hypothetical protein
MRGEPPMECLDQWRQETSLGQCEKMIFMNRCRISDLMLPLTYKALSARTPRTFATEQTLKSLCVNI